MTKDTTRTGVTARLIGTGSLVGLIALAVAVPSATGRAPGVQATVVEYEPPVRTEAYSYTDYGRSASPRDDKTGTAKFRVIERTGNCCENYVTVSRDGILYDLGGSYINFTGDDGKTWQQVRPAEPLVNGEGAISMAPNGDVVGIEWDPYSGDHLLSYKYDVAAEQWQFFETPLHTPFYDRPWLTVVPGPFTVRGTEVPYVVFVDGFPHRGPMLYSTDGITYVETSNPFLDQKLRPGVKSWLKTTKSRDLDWVLPNSESPITALGAGYAVAAPGPFDSSWALFDPETLTWSSISLPEGDIPERLLVDSKGRLHSIRPAGRTIDYRISPDGGKTWSTTTLTLPEGQSASQVDFRVNAGIGVAVVGAHANGQKGDGDVLFKVDISSNQPRATRMYEIGLADINASSGVGQEIRFDFETVAIFPDGRIAVSFLDSTTGPVYHLQEPVRDRLGPALAIEL